MLANTKLSQIGWGEELSLPQSHMLRTTPHIIGGRYPCRSVAFIPEMILNNFHNEKESLSVLDPFMGSGTTAIEALKFTNSVSGLEVDPYARLVATVATRKYSGQIQRRLNKQVAAICNEFRLTPIDPALEPKLENIEYWFSQDHFDDLLRLKTTIFRVSNNNVERDFLLAILGDIIRACSKAERQSLKPYISKKYPKIPKPILPQFKQTADRYLLAISSTENYSGNGIRWVNGNATNFVVEDKVNLAITSPPYINAIDYVRCVKLESAWIGTGDDSSLKKVRTLQLGDASRNKFVKISKAVENCIFHQTAKIKRYDVSKFNCVRTFFQDLYDNFLSVHSALKSDGDYFLIIGNSTIRSVEIPTHEIAALLAEQAGFAWRGYFKYKIKDHRTSIPRNNRGGKIEYEHVIRLSKHSSTKISTGSTQAAA